MLIARSVTPAAPLAEGSRRRTDGTGTHGRGHWLPAGRAQLRVAALLIVICVRAAAFPVPLAAQQAPSPVVPGDWHFGFEMFEMLLEQRGLQHVQTAADAFSSPSQTVIVIIGELPNEQFWSEAWGFLQGGGRILVASDQDGIARRWFRMNAGPVTTNRRAYQYQRHGDCLQIVDLDESHPLTSGVKTVIVNRSGWLSDLSDTGTNWQIVAQLPPLTFPSESAGMPLIAVSEWRSSGRLILVADHSLLTNGMLWHGDNAMLAINLCHSLCHPDRQKLMFIVDGQLQGTYALRLPPNVPPPAISLPPKPKPPESIPELPVDQMVRIANLVVTKVEDSNLLNSAVMQRPRDVPAAYFHRGLLLAAVLAALVVMARALTNSSPSLAVPTQTRDMLSAADLNAVRQDTAEGRGLAARLLVFELCRQLTSSRDPADWRKLVTEQSLAGDSRALPKSVRETIPLLLSLAFGSRTPHLSRTRFLDVGRAVEHIRSRNAAT
ncbi:MAG: DUF4350 domain-containing protein [Planctomycetaceae bacterium]